MPSAPFYFSHPILFKDKQQYIAFNILNLNKTIHVHLEISKFTSSLHIMLFSFGLSLQFLLERVKVRLNT